VLCFRKIAKKLASKNAPPVSTTIGCDLTTGVVDTGGKFTVGVSVHIFPKIYFNSIDIGGGWPPVSTTPVVNKDNSSR
jgi:hypothetical protein